MPLFDWIRSDLHSLNLDWIISKIKTVEESEQGAVDAAADANASKTAAAASATAANNSKTAAAGSATLAAVSAQQAQNLVDQLDTTIAQDVTDWLDEHITPTTPAVDDTLTVSGAAADAAVTGDKITELKTEIINSTTHVPVPLVINAVNPDALEDGYYDGDGNNAASTTFKRSTEYTPCVPNAHYKIVYAKPTAGYFSEAVGGICFYDKSKNFIVRQTNQSTYIAPNNAAFFRFYTSETNKAMVYEGDTTPLYYSPYGIEFITTYQAANESYIANSFKQNIVQLLNGFEKNWNDDTITEVSGSYMNLIGNAQASASWKYLTCDCKPNALYKTFGRGASGAYRVMILDNYGRLIAHYPATAAAGTAEDEFITPYNAAQIIVNGNTSDAVYIKKLNGLTVSQGTYATKLNGKRLHACGDSITLGANVSAFPSGYKKTYCGYVAENNSMNMSVDAIGGSTMGNVSIDGYVMNGFAISRYQNIPADADYVTIMFGWNDSAYGWKSKRDAYCMSNYNAYYSELTAEQKAEVDSYRTWRQWLSDYVGTENSNDDTTWFGAWNKVLGWLLANRPSAKVGIICEYGIYEELQTALSTACENYGYTLLNACNADEMFSVGHSNGINSNQMESRKALYTLDGTHPNELGYELMSDYYEHFLMKI